MKVMGHQTKGMHPVTKTSHAFGEKLKSLPNAEHCLKSGMSFEALYAYAAATSDNEAPHQMNEARTQLFQTIYKRSRKAA